MPYDAYPTQTPGQQVVAGLQAFSESVNKLAQQHSLQQAQSQIDDANNTISDEFERSQRIKQVGQALAFQLAGSGADASHIAAVMGAIPKPDAPPQNVLEGYASLNPRIQAAAKAYQAEQFREKLGEIGATGENKLAVATIQANQRAQKAKEAEQQDAIKNFNKQVGAFNKRDDVKPIISSLDDIETAQQQLAQAKNNPAAFQSAKVGALLAAKLKRITTTELKGETGTQGLVASAETAAANLLEGKQSQRDLDAIQAVLEVARQSNSKQIKDKAVGYSAMLGSSPGSKFSQKDYYMQLHQNLFAIHNEALPDFDASGRIVSNAQGNSALNAGGAAAPQAQQQAPGTGSAFGIPGFSLK